MRPEVKRQINALVSAVMDPSMKSMVQYRGENASHRERELHGILTRAVEDFERFFEQILPPEYVYLVRSNQLDGNGPVKIGMTRSENPMKRIDDLNTYSAHGITLLGLAATPNALKLERELHEKHRDKRMNGEWFQFTPEDIAQFLSDPRFTKMDPPCQLERAQRIVMTARSSNP